MMKDKIVVITGAGSGIGRALALEYGKLGARLALNDFIADDLDATIALLKEMGIEKVLRAVFDVADKNSMDEFARQVKQDWGNAQVVINNAGISGADLPGYLIPEANYRRVLDVNFFGVLNGCQAFLPQMVEGNEGAVVNISSTFGLVGTPNNTDYCASKFAVRGYTEALAVEFQASPISIHCVHPGGVNTNIARNANTSEFKEKYLKTPPEKLARHIIRSVKKGKVKIVYGHSALKLWFLGNLVPQRLTNWLAWNASKKILDLNNYRKFIRSI